MYVLQRTGNTQGVVLKKDSTNMSMVHLLAVPAGRICASCVSSALVWSPTFADHLNQFISGGHACLMCWTTWSVWERWMRFKSEGINPWINEEPISRLSNGTRCIFSSTLTVWSWMKCLFFYINTCFVLTRAEYGWSHVPSTASNSFIHRCIHSCRWVMRWPALKHPDINLITIWLCYYNVL